MKGFTHSLAHWIGTRSVFSYLLATALFSTFALSLVLILSLQRVADEHPRRYLARTLFDAFTELSLQPGNEDLTIGPSKLVRMTAEEAENSEFAALFRVAERDKDGVAIMRYGDFYAAASVRNGQFAVLPQFGQRISAFALMLVGIVVFTTIAVVVAIYFLMRKVTRPFSVLSEGIRRVEDGDLNYQMPLDETYGEFRTFAGSFNGMVAELQRVHEARRHMLLALPHELLTPLSRLKVRKELVDDAELRTKISKDISVVEEILSSILAAERRQSGNIVTEFVAIGPYAQEQIAQQIDQGVDIKVVNLTGKTEAYFDPFMVSVLLKNFVSNAVRYGEGKAITVRFEIDSADPCDMRLSVEDQGIGIDEDQLKYLTEPFWRADESRGRASGGYGLGLYLCNTIAEGIGGRIEIESELGAGTKIAVVIPNAICETIEDIKK